MVTIHASTHPSDLVRFAPHWLDCILTCICVYVYVRARLRMCLCVCVGVCFVAYYTPSDPSPKKPFPTFHQYTNDFSSFDKHIIGYLLHSDGRDLRRGFTNVQSSHLDHTFPSSSISIDTILCHSFCHQLMNVI